MPTAKPSYNFLPSEAHATVIYPIQVNLEYRSARVGKVRISGSGVAVGISNEEIVFEAEAGLPPGVAIELWIEWPAKLNSVMDLALVARGRTTRTSTGHSAVRILNYEFRTRTAQMAGAAICTSV